MPEKDDIYSSKIKKTGIFNFSDYYNFNHNWLVEELKYVDFQEDKYTEKLVGDAKNIEIEWTCKRKMTDYFQFQIKVKYRILGLTDIEVTKNGVKTKTNKGSVEVIVTGTLIKDYEGKFEQNGVRKFLRSIYEKWVIPSRVTEYEDKLAGHCEEFLNQGKAYLDLEVK
ncbi:MAG TPA: hypothetical protein VMC07_02355 [Candidatus Omnitrophota bacterium]|nr:hypothetical protein [Candidatus Omnitrophota bacterium]